MVKYGESWKVAGQIIIKNWIVVVNVHNIG
jgi:hypothetical protein